MQQFDLIETLLMLPAILFGLSIHEFWHAFTATRYGDDTPAKQGRLTLNPLAHIDWIGFFLLIYAGFGWAKPVQVNPQAFRNPKRDDVLVSIAGPLSNLVTAVIFALIIKGLFMFASDLFAIADYGEYIRRILVYFVWFNLVLFVFNLIPLPPLDGSHVLFALLPDRFQHLKEQFFRFGGIALMALIFVGSWLNIDLLPIGKITQTIYQGLFHLLGLY